MGTNQELHKHSRSNFGIIAKIEASGFVSAVVLTVEDKYRHNALHKSWIFPGGSMEPGETDRVNLVRELGEEISFNRDVLTIPLETIDFILELKKPGDYGGRLTQNFWYVPLTDSIRLRGDEKADLMEDDGACLGKPMIIDVADIILRRDFKLAHVAAATVFMERLMDEKVAGKVYRMSAEMSKNIRSRYFDRLEPYIKKTHHFLELLRPCRDRKEYTQILYRYGRLLNYIREKIVRN